MPAKPAKATARPKRSRAEVQEKFAEIQQQVKEERESPDTKAAAVARLHEAEVRQTVEEVTVEGVVQRITGLGLDLSKALSGIGQKLTEEVQLLAAVREAVALERKELERLHTIDIAATAIDQMVQDYAREKQRLESEISEQRAAWEAESERTERDRKEQEEALKKQRQREIEDYDYKRNLERKKALDKYDEEVRLVEKKNQERQEELARLRKESEEFPARLRKEAAAAAEQARRETEARFEQQTLVLKKDAEAEKRLAELQVKTLDGIVARQTEQIAALERQLADAKQQVQDIAVKAIEGASGAKALSHINQIAMEQAKNRPQGRGPLRAAQDLLRFLPMRIAAAILLLTCTGWAQFKSTVPLVVAPTTVTDSKGRYVDGLTPEDLILYDNNVPQAIQMDWTMLDRIAARQGRVHNWPSRRPPKDS